MSQTLKKNVSFTEELVSGDNLPNLVDSLFEDGYLVFNCIRVLDRGPNELNRFTLFYDLFNPELFRVHILMVNTGDSCVVPSIAHRWQSAINFERKIFELHGVRFSPHFWNRHFVHASVFAPFRVEADWSISRKDVDSWPFDKTVLQEELQLREKECHFYKRGAWSDQLDLSIRKQGGNVLDLAMRTHLLKDRTLTNHWSSMINFLDCIHPYYSEHWVQSWYRLQEDIAKIEIPERAMAIRMVMLEISRVTGHLAVLGEIFRSLKQGYLFERTSFWLEQIVKLKRYLIGDKLNSFPLLLGGVKRDVSAEWVSLSIEMMEKVLDSVKELRSLLEVNSKLYHALDNGIVTGSEALTHGLGGVNLRASGINWDERKRLPHYFYDQLDFDIPIGTKGNNFDRVLLKVDEVIISSSMIIQLLDNLPQGEVQNAEWPLERVAFDGFPPIENSLVRYFEAPHGFIGFSYSKGDGWRLSTPSFRSHCLPSQLVRSQLEENEAKVTLASFAWSSGEMFL